MSNSNSSPVCCPAIQPVLHKASILPKLSSLEPVIVVPSFRKRARLLCTAHQSTLGQPWRSSPAKYHQSTVWQMPWGKAAKAKERSKPDTTTQVEKGVKGMSTENVAPYQMILLKSCLTRPHDKDGNKAFSKHICVENATK